MNRTIGSRLKFKQNLSWRLAIISTLAAVMLSVYVVIAQFLMSIKDHDDAVQSQLEQLVEAIRKPTEIAIYQLDYALANEIANGLLLRDYVTAVSIIGDIGESMAEVKKELDQTTTTLMTWTFDERIRRFDVPLSFEIAGQSLNGSLIIEYDYHRMFQPTISNLWQDITLSLLELLFLLGLILAIFHRMVTKPLLSLSQSITQYNIESDDQDDIPDIKGHQEDEIGQLVTSFNDQLTITRALLESNQMARHHAEGAINSFNSLIDALPQFITVRLFQGEFAFSNQAFRHRMLPTDTHLELKDVDDFFERINRRPLQIMREADEQVIETGQTVFIPEIAWATPNGEELLLEVRKLVIQFNTEKAILTVASDVSERKEHQAQLQHLAYHDALTSLPNRHLFIDRLEQAMLKAQRSGHFGALIFIDLDDFKLINDSRGHFAGDSLLISLAKRLRESVREEDTIARLGGDEFVVCMSDVGHSAMEAAKFATERAHRILDLVAHPYSINGSQMSIGASLGIAFFHDHSITASELLTQADLAMYKAKEQGKNQVILFEQEMADASLRLQKLKSDCLSALENDEFFLVFQPQLDSQTNRIIGAEALLRWQHPSDGLMPPGQFIPLLEDLDLMPLVGQYVLDTALKQTKQWLQSGLINRHFKIAINVSPQQFRQNNFVEATIDTINQVELPPNMVDLEITESMIIDNIDHTVEAMKQLRALGVKFSIDDFGTGYSNLNYLKKLPLDVLKVDQSFVRDIQFNPHETVIVRTILAMADQLNLSTVAEGVETPSQLKLLQEMGCHVYQGYLFSPPLETEDFEQLLNQN